MQSVSRNLEPSILANTLTKTPLMGNVQKVASVLITCCKYLADHMVVNSITDAQTKIENLVKRYINLRIMWIGNNRGRIQLCLMDRDNNVYQTGICMSVINNVFLIWLWRNPEYANTLTR